RLPRAGSADEEHAFRGGAAKPRVLFRILEKVHDFDQFILGFVDARHVVKLDLRLLFLIVAAGLALSDAHHPPAHQAAALLRRSPKEPDIKTYEEEPRAETEEQSQQR